MKIRRNTLQTHSFDTTILNVHCVPGTRNTAGDKTRQKSLLSWHRQPSWEGSCHKPSVNDAAH